MHAQLDELAELSKELFARHAATTSAASATASAAAQEAASVRAELVALTTAHRVLQQQQRSVLDQLGELSQSLLEQQRRWLEGAPRVPDVNVVKVDEAAMGGQGGQGGQGGAEGGNGAEGGAKNGAEGGAENGAEGGAENGAEGGAENGASAQRIRALERQLAEDEQRLVAVAAGDAAKPAQWRPSRRPSLSASTRLPLRMARVLSTAPWVSRQRVRAPMHRPVQHPM